MQRIRVASLNISGLTFPPFLDARTRAIAEGFEKESCDIVCFQEVHTYASLLVLKKYMVSYRHIKFQKSYFGPRAGLVIFSKFPLRSTRFFRVRRGSKKGILIAETDETTVVNLHLSANKDGDWSSHGRYYHKQARQLEDVRAVLSHMPIRRLIVAGDFNVARVSELYANFIRSNGLVDAAGDTTLPTFHQQFLPNDRSAQAIDHILVRGFSAQHFYQMFDQKSQLHNGQQAFVSSHRAIVAEIVAN